MNTDRKGSLLMLGVVSLWSTSAIFLEFIPWDPIFTAGARAIPSGITVLAYLLWKKIPVRFDRQTVKIAVPMALTCVLFIVAARLSNAANAAALQLTSPVFLLLISVVFLHKRFSRGDVIVVFTTLIGVALFFCEQFEPEYVLGNAVAVATGLCAGTMYIFLGNDVSEPVRMNATFLSNIISVIICLPFMLHLPEDGGAPAVLSIIGLGMIQTGLAYIVLSKASACCPPLTISLLSATGPLLNAMWRWLLYGHAPTPFAFAGMAVIVGSIVIWNLCKARKAKGKT